MKFENLLRQLYWIGAALYLENEIGGSYRYEWIVAPDQIDRLLLDPPLPVEHWTREGGPS